MENKLIAVIMTATVAIILSGAVLAPTLDAAAQDFEKVESDQANVLNYMSLADSVTFEQTTGDYTVAMDGEILTDLVRNQALLISDNVIITAVVVSSSTTTNLTMAIWAPGYNAATLSAIANNITVVLDDGEITITYGSNTATFEATYAYVYDPNGNYANITKNYVSAVNANAGDDVILYAQGAWWGNTYAPVVVAAETGTVTGSTTKYAAGQTSGTSADMSVVFATVKYDNLQATSCTPSDMSAILPATYEKYESNSYSILMPVLLVLVLASIVIGFAGMIYYKKG